MVSTPTSSPERTDSEEVMLPPRRTQDTDSRVVPRLGAKKGPEYVSGHKSFLKSKWREEAKGTEHTGNKGGLGKGKEDWVGKEAMSPESRSGTRRSQASPDSKHSTQQDQPPSIYSTRHHDRQTAVDIKSTVGWSQALPPTPYIPSPFRIHPF